MARQRWYAGKGGVPRLRTVGDIPLDSVDPDARIHILLLADDADPRRSVYQVPVVERRGVPDGFESHLIGPNGDRAVFDGPYDPAFAAALLGTIRGDAHPDGPDQVTGSGVISGEQSNTSIVVSTRAAGEVMVKVFRVVQHGQNPDAELQGALSSTGAEYVPRYVGALDAEWRDAGDASGTGQLAVAQEFLRGAEDGWLTARRAVDAGADFSREAFELGRATAALHATLAARLPTEQPAAATVAAMTAIWTSRLDAAIRDVPSLSEHRDAIQIAYTDAATSQWPRLQRIHGDLHLGQILHAEAGGVERWVFIDFEGEPLRTIEERTRPEPPLRDLAGMLRSFDYAAASSSHPDADAWARRAGDAYLAGYGDAGGSIGDHALLTAFELDKAVYEASYEARNRPSWLTDPAAGDRAPVVEVAGLGGPSSGRQTGPVTDLGDIAGELYGLDLDAFTAERNRRAKELRASDRELADAVAALPKPSAAAWLVDQLVRAEPDEVATALALGADLRAAQASFDRDALRELGRERREALSRLADLTRRVSADRGRPLGSSIADEVEQTLLAGIADEAAGAAVRSGRLVRSLLTVGGEAVDLDGAVAAPGEQLASRARAAGPRASVAKAPAASAGPSRAERAQSDLADARASAAEARQGLADADAALTAAVQRQEELVADRDDALAEYERLEREVGEAERQRRESIRERDRANRRMEGADRVVARAEARLEAD